MFSIFANEGPRLGQLLVLDLSSGSPGLNYATSNGHPGYLDYHIPTNNTYRLAVDLTSNAAHTCVVCFASIRNKATTGSEL